MELILYPSDLRPKSRDVHLYDSCYSDFTLQAQAAMDIAGGGRFERRDDYKAVRCPQGRPMQWVRKDEDCRLGVE